MGLILVAVFPSSTTAQEMPCILEPPYEAPAHKDPIVETRKSKLQLKDNGDGTLTDPHSNLMWTQKDSYADLNKCLTYLGP